MGLRPLRIVSRTPADDHLIALRRASLVKYRILWYFILMSAPETYLAEVAGHEGPFTYLDPADPFDDLVIRYHEAFEDDVLPKGTEQRKMVTGLQDENIEAARELVQTHKSLIAAVAYPFKASGIQGGELLRAGTKALLAAAKTYDTYGAPSFDQYATEAIGDLLNLAYPAALEGSVHTPITSVEDLILSMAKLKVADNVDLQAMRRRKAMQPRFALLTPTEHEVLPLLHLSLSDIDEQSGMTGKNIVNHTSNIKGKIGADSREELALTAWEAGVPFRLRVPSVGIEELTIRQRTVAMHLTKRNDEIAAEQGLSESQVRRDVTALLESTEARNRVELLLMAYEYHFEPTQDELAIYSHEALQGFSEFQRPIAARIHMPIEEVALEVDRSEEAVRNAVSRIVSRAGHKGQTARTALALDLFDRGFRFDVRPPTKPFAETLSAKELEVGRQLQFSSAEIAGSVDSIQSANGIESLISYIKGKTGARTRAELALQIRMYDTGESRPKYINELSSEERFFQALGIEPVPLDVAHSWLDHTTPKQAEYLEARFFSEKELSIQALANRFSVAKSTILATVARGLKNISEALEDQEKTGATTPS